MNRRSNGLDRAAVDDNDALAGLKAVIATHVYATSACDELRTFLLRKKTAKLLWIAHPLMYAERLSGSGFALFSDGAERRSWFPRIRKIPPVIGYFKDFFSTIAFTLGARDRFDVFIGVDPLNAIAGLVLKRIGITRRCVFYAIDYSPRRFQNSALNWIYHQLETLCATRCDETWNLSERMIEARLRFKGIRPDAGRQRVVPMGIWYREIERVPIEQVDKTEVIFMGHLLKKQGVQYFLAAMPELARQIPGIRLSVIGDGEYRATLEAMAAELGISDRVQFHGYVEDHAEVCRRIARAAVALALYERGDDISNFSYYSDPGKLKVYLGAGVPVLMSDVPHNAREIEERGCGLIVDLSPASIVAGVRKLIDPARLPAWREHALEFAREYDWNAIFSRAFAGVPDGRDAHRC